MSRILVIEKDALNLQLMKDLLENAGHQVTVASGFDMSIREVRQEFQLFGSSADLIILGDTDHPSVERIVVESMVSTGKKDKLLIVSANFVILNAPLGEKTVVHAARDLEDQPAFLSKPFALSRFLAAVEALIGKPSDSEATAERSSGGAPKGGFLAPAL